LGRYILGRILSLVFVLFAVSLIAFLLMHAVPGGPFDIGERRLPEETRIAQMEKYGLNEPLGVPFQRPTETVTGLIASRWPVTIAIGIPTIIIAYTFGTLLGAIAAIRQNSWIDYVVTTVGTLGLTVPSWVIGTWLVLMLSVRWDLLPTGGWGEPKHYIMPIIAYSLAPMALVARYTRLTLIETMRSDYVRTARAKGLSENRIMAGHIARNAAIPWVTVLLPEIPNILTGSIFIEAIFNIPGLGSYFVTSTISRDYPMILALTLLIAALWGVTYLITDLLYTVLDPRVRLVGGRVG
jgi:ABC-type dipeptide/oligopeptide/nickel transport system permease component